MKPEPALVRVVTAAPRLTSDVRGLAGDPRPLLVSGPPSTAVELRARLAEDGDPDLVRRVGILDLERPELAGSSGLVYAIKGGATPADEHALRRADRQRIPIVCVILSDRPPDGRVLPYVLATDVVRTPAIDRAALDAIASRLAARAPEAAWVLAARLPALRPAVSRALVERYARRNAGLGAATFVPGPDLPALTLNELRLALRLAAMEGRDPQAVQAVALAASVATGLTLRTVARSLTRLLPLPAWAIQAAVAYAGTRALGAAALGLAGRTRVT